MTPRDLHWPNFSFFSPLHDLVLLYGPCSSVLSVTWDTFLACRAEVAGYILSCCSLPPHSWRQTLGTWMTVNVHEWDRRLRVKIKVRQSLICRLANSPRRLWLPRKIIKNRTNIRAANNWYNCNILLMCSKDYVDGFALKLSHFNCTLTWLLVKFCHQLLTDWVYQLLSKNQSVSQSDKNQLVATSYWLDIVWLIDWLVDWPTDSSWYIAPPARKHYVRRVSAVRSHFGPYFVSISNSNWVWGSTFAIYNAILPQ